MNILEKIFILRRREARLLPGESVSILGNSATYYSQDIPTENYSLLGFKSLEEARYWKENGCGIPCVQMVVKNLTNIDTSFIDLLRRGTELHAFEDPTGWIHSGLAQMIEEYGIDASCKKFHSLEEAARQIKNGRVIILSVTAGFRGKEVVVENGKERIKERGGHLVFVFGYKADKSASVEAFLVHDPDYWPEYRKINVWVNREELKRSWTGNAIICKTTKR